LGLGVERKHCWLRGTVGEAIVESLWHCAVKNGAFLFLKVLEKEEMRFRLGTVVFDIIAAVNTAEWKMS
jgi:hypothetical protein